MPGEVIHVGEVQGLEAVASALFDHEKPIVVIIGAGVSEELDIPVGDFCPSSTLLADLLILSLDFPPG